MARVKMNYPRRRLLRPQTNKREAISFSMAPFRGRFFIRNAVAEKTLLYI
jgi:hypothetical protein